MNRTGRFGLALVQAALAYEWLSSALTKLVHGGFPAGLARDLQEVGAGGVYGTFLRHVVIPHGVAFGWAIQLTELLVALLFLAGALSGRTLFLGLAASAGAFMTFNFGLAAGDHFLSLVGGDAFDEGVPLDVLATWLQLGLLVYVVAPYLRVEVPWLRSSPSCVSSPARWLGWSSSRAGGARRG